MATLSVVVPTYQEHDNLRALSEQLAEVFAEHKLDAEIIIVDDNSQDGTEELVAELVQEGHPIQLIVRREERGLSSAVIRGFREAKGEFLLCMDADLSHPPQAVPDILAKLQEDGVDFVIGSRYVPGGATEGGWGLFRWLNSKGATLLARPFTRAKDPMAGFFCLRRATFEQAAPLNPVGYKIGLELIVKCDCRNVQEVPIHFANRVAGESKLSLKEQLNYIKHLKRLADYKFGWFSYFMQFCMVGGTGVVVDLTSVTVLLKMGVVFGLARAMAIWIAMTWNFGLNRRLTFSYSRNENIFLQYIGFCCTCLLGGLINWSVSISLAKYVEFFSAHQVLAAFAGVLLGTVSNFMLSRYFVFRKKTNPPQSDR